MYIDSLGRDAVALGKAEYKDYPPECAAGLYAGSHDVKDQSSPLCAGLCQPGKICGKATVVPAACDLGGYRPEGSPAARSCPS